jgi:hypothetical protein
MVGAVMPYIKKENQELLAAGIPASTPGELNFVFTMLCKLYFQNNGANYQAINDIVGALEGAKFEFYRRVATPYEDKKIKENGDVY